MISRSRYEKFLLKDVRELSDNDFRKVVKTIHFFKKEIFKQKHGNVYDVLRFAGIWKQMGPEKVGIFSDILKERDKFSEGRTFS
ncbi:MAG: hypothetical protein K0A89_12325 [ANME-2 cluster archaeon]|nr:hypothetical protein [ANME-2 cluster archaeon]